MHLVAEQFSEQERKEQEAGGKIAERRREHKRWTKQWFLWYGSHSFKRGDKIMMVTKESSGKRLVDPPGTVLYVRNFRTRSGQAAIVFLEFQDMRRRQLRMLAKALGRGAMKRLHRGGTLRRDLSENLYDLWNAQAA